MVTEQEKGREARLVESACTLTEGQVCKLLIRKSGKVQRLLGKVTLDVMMGTACSLLLSCLWALETVGWVRRQSWDT